VPLGASPWESRAACEAALARGDKLPRHAGTARIGSWNIRWFPDGKPGHRSAEEGTDVRWLACAIAWLDVDVLAVQEIKTDANAKRALAELSSVLDEHTGGRWSAELDRCPNEGGQHVGVLYDAKKARLGPVVTLASLNPHSEACKDQLRPGLGAHFTFRGGLDLHVVSVHAKSGQERRSLELRAKSLAGIARALTVLRGSEPDDDVLFAGDFNTMGCSKCSPRVSAQSELDSIDRVLAALPTPFRRVLADASCSELSGHRSALLDHFLVPKAMTELDASARSLVSGPCARSSCKAGAGHLADAAVRRLSDHCPVVIDLRDRDED
jgi:endonuclease/exonuclease/phosphatase family metal-dependent hydrolase